MTAMTMTAMTAGHLFWHEQNRGTSCCLGTHHQYLRNIGRLRGTADEGAVAVVSLIELDAFVGLVHVVHDLALRQEDDQVLRDEADGLLLHRLGHPHAGILGHTELSTDNTYIGAVQVAGSPYVVWIPRGNRNAGSRQSPWHQGTGL